MTKILYLSEMLTSLALLLFPWKHVLTKTCQSSYSLPNTKLEGHVIKNCSAMQSNYQCSAKCASQEGCHSINYCPSQGICELNNANHLSNPESVIYSAGCQYLNYFVRAVSRCSNKLCNHNFECEMDKNEQDYKCKPCKDKDKVLKFSNKTVADYVIYENPFVQLTSFTLSMWVQVNSSFGNEYHTAFSYAIPGIPTDVLRIDLRNTQSILWLNGEYRIFSSVCDGEWHHICATWSNVDGSYLIYIDGTSNGHGNMRTGYVIQMGTVVLGQDQDSYKGGFQIAQSFQGNLTGVNMWDKVFTAEEASDLASRCSTAEGNVLKWTDFHDRIIGNLKLICSSLCSDP